MAVSGEEASHGISDSIVTEFATYEDFLDSQITPTDLYYLEVSYSLQQRWRLYHFIGAKMEVVDCDGSLMQNDWEVIVINTKIGGANLALKPNSIVQKCE